MTELETSFHLFRPNYAQSMAKVRLLRRLDDRKLTIDIEALSVDELALYARDRRVKEWLKDPEFAAWFTDRDTFAKQALAMREFAVRALYDILDADPLDRPDIKPRDRLTAANMLLQVTSSFPAKTVVRYEDKDLETMPDDEVQRQIAENNAKLGRTSN